jgi:hypothetical protein
MPITFTTGNWTFNGSTGLWYDPPLVGAFEYDGTSGTTFNSITLPGGYSSVNVFSGPAFSTFLGTCSAGSTVDFVALTGASVGAFRIVGINPNVDAADPNAYPVQIFFNSPTGSITQTVIPEPGTFGPAIAGLDVFMASKSRKISQS